MSSDVYRRLQALSRGLGRPTDEMMTLYALERTLHRLSVTRYRNDFSLKGGVLLAAFALRRPTRDIDMQALHLRLDEDHLRTVVAAIARVDADDGLRFDVDHATVQLIRDEDEYTGLRITVPTALHSARVQVRLDISTGDPIWPAPQPITLPGLLGDDVTMLGHPLPTVVAEKSVTVLQRGTTSTRWRDFLDLRNLARTHRFLAGDLASAIDEVARHRRVAVGPLVTATAGYEAVAQRKWAAWRRAHGHHDALPSFRGQLDDVLAFVDPVLTGLVGGIQEWQPFDYSWASKPASPAATPSPNAGVITVTPNGTVVPNASPAPGTGTATPQ